MLTSKRKADRHRMRGAAAIEGLFWLTALGVAIGNTASSLQSERAGLVAAGIGNELRLVTSAIQSRITTPPGIPDGTYEDWRFLQSVDCGGTAPDHFLPCDLSVETSRLGEFFSRIDVVTVASSVPGVDMQVATLTTNPVARNAGDAPDVGLAGMVASYANGFRRSSTSTEAGDRGVYFTVDQATGRILGSTAVQPVDDERIRIDGASLVRGDLLLQTDADGNPQFDILNNRTILAQRLVLGGVPIDPSGESTLSRIAADVIRFNRFEDADDPAFFIDLETGESRLNELRINQHFRLTSEAVMGAPCPEPRTLARDADGALLWCQGGVWVTPGHALPSGSVVAFNESTCPSGFERYVNADGRVITGRTNEEVVGQRAGADLTRLEPENWPKFRIQIDGAPGLTPNPNFHYGVRPACANSRGGCPAHENITIYRGLSAPINNKTGPATPFENRMPVVAVNWCRKL